MKEKDKKKILKKIRRNESLEIQKQVDLREKIHINKRKYKSKKKYKDEKKQTKLCCFKVIISHI